MKSIFPISCMVAYLIFGLAVTSHAQHSMHSSDTPLTKPGNEIFGTIQEVIHKLEADQNTDWAKVDLEALRQHLLDMKAFTEEVAVVSNENIPMGTKVRIRPQTERASAALERLFGMHPAMIKKELGWNMKAEQADSEWIITCITDKPSEVDKIRGLGYIGLMAEGAHHQRHHWMIASGQMGMGH